MHEGNKVLTRLPSDLPVNKTGGGNADSTLIRSGEAYLFRVDPPKSGTDEQSFNKVAVELSRRFSTDGLTGTQTIKECLQAFG